MPKRKTKDTEERIFFVSCIIERYKKKKRLTGNVVATLFREKNITQWLYDNYETLHSESEDNVVHEIGELFGI